MASTSTSAVEPSSETRNWLEMPDEIMGGMILQRLDVVEILTSVQKVCTTWRRICKNPAMWKIIDLDFSSSVWYTKNDLEKLCKLTVNRSCGELIDIRFKCFGTDDLLDFISRCSSKLKCLRLTNCYSVMRFDLVKALERLPHLETLDLCYSSYNAEDVEVIGRSCPQLKSFKMKTRFMGCVGDADAIANSMPALRHLQLFGSAVTDDGLYGILHGCPHLESLDVRRCFDLNLDGNLLKSCRERIKDFKFTPPRNDEDYEFSDSDSDGPYEDYEFPAGDTVLSEDDIDYYRLRD